MHDYFDIYMNYGEKRTQFLHTLNMHFKNQLTINAAINGKLELTLLKGRQRFDTVSMSNLKV